MRLHSLFELVDVPPMIRRRAFNDFAGVGDGDDGFGF